MILILYVICGFIYSVNSEYSGVTYTGLLIPQCLQKYQKLNVKTTAQPNYQYYHETLGPSGYDENRRNTDLKWRIIGGSKVSIKQVPYQVLYGRRCGGSLIAPEWVLTAAHCGTQEKFIMAGSTRRSEALHYPICAHFLHPGWNGTKIHRFDYDYQLVLLERAVPVTPRSRPIAIGSLEDIVPGRLTAVSGWGHTTEKGLMDDRLHRVLLPIMPGQQCTSLPIKSYQITSRMFCAGFINGTKDSCQGDSGGPAALYGKLVGVVSFGVGCALKDRPGVYSNVPMARDWIRAITGLPL